MGLWIVNKQMPGLYKQFDRITNSLNRPKNKNLQLETMMMLVMKMIMVKSGWVHHTRDHMIITQAALVSLDLMLDHKSWVYLQPWGTFTDQNVIFCPEGRT